MSGHGFYVRLKIISVEDNDADPIPSRHPFGNSDLTTPEMGKEEANPDD
jgi:hypothetical protein